MKNAVYLFILVFIFPCFKVSGQAIREDLVLTDSKDSIILKGSYLVFDLEGNYCLQSEKNDEEFFITNKGIFGKTKFIGSMSGTGGGISYTNSYSDPKSKKWYYRNTQGSKVFGPVIGKLEKYMTGHTKNNIAIATSFNDTVYYYVNGKLVSKNLRKQLNSFDINHYEWCSFSESGNSIYYIKKDSLYYLYVNEKLIDKSPNNFNELHINNEGYYVYAEGRRPKTKIDGYDYMFFVHTKDTSIGAVRTVWDNDLCENNSYYYSGDDNGSDYIIINNNMIKGIEQVSKVTFSKNGNYLFTYQTKGTKPNTINVNGNDHSFDFESIYYPTLDDDGNYSFYGIKDYYLYKYINGEKSQNPITKFGVRPIPLYISPIGESIHLFKTDDSLYLYRNETELFKLSKRTNFRIIEGKDLFPSDYVRGKSQTNNSLFYLEVDTVGYIVFNGSFSKSMMKASENSYSKEKPIGEIVAGKLTDLGYFLIQKTGPNKYFININNSIYKEIDNIDYLLRDNFFFTKDKLIFFGVKGLSIYKYTIEI